MKPTKKTADFGYRISHVFVTWRGRLKKKSHKVKTLYDTYLTCLKRSI